MGKTFSLPGPQFMLLQGASVEQGNLEYNVRVNLELSKPKDTLEFSLAKLSVWIILYIWTSLLTPKFSCVF
jgi:hypothetical protein